VKDPAQTGSSEKIGVLLGIFVSQLQPFLLNLGFSTKGSLLVISQDGGDPIQPGRGLRRSISSAITNLMECSVRIPLPSAILPIPVPPS
jgi:hypothetical protein